MQQFLFTILLVAWVFHLPAQNEVNIIKVRRGGGDSRVMQINNSSIIVYAVATVKPEFPGGEEALKDYLLKNMIYPKPEFQKKMCGTVKVTFVVETSGFISVIKVFVSSTTNFNNEALRLISSMPRWIPGQYKDQLVPVQVTLPVVFKAE